MDGVGRLGVGYRGVIKNCFSGVGESSYEHRVVGDIHDGVVEGVTHSCESVGEGGIAMEGGVGHSHEGVSEVGVSLTQEWVIVMKSWVRVVWVETEV